MIYLKTEVLLYLGLVMGTQVKIQKNADISGLIVTGEEQKFAVVLMHAYNQSPEDINLISKPLAEKGVVVLAPKYADAADGVNRAINTIRFAKTRLGLDSSRMGVAGVSLGGTVSLLASTQEPVAFVGNYGGWVDMADLYEYLIQFPRGSAQRMIAETMKAAVGDPHESRDIYAMSSPISYVEMISGSVLIVHGSKDDMVPPRQSRILYDNLKKLGKDVELHLIDEAGYLFTGCEAKVAEITVEFLRKRGKI